MSRISAVVLLSLPLAMPAMAADPPPERGPLSVSVQARPDEAARNAREQMALKAKSESASESRSDLERA